CFMTKARSRNRVAGSPGAPCPPPPLACHFPPGRTPAVQWTEPADATHLVAHALAAEAAPRRASAAEALDRIRVARHRAPLRRAHAASLARASFSATATLTNASRLTPCSMTRSRTARAVSRGTRQRTVT